ncbi:MAG: cell division protein SepF [Candidatus Freyarchaeota archaeon]|nr:cell division protein SepF [Candidatus Freyrarchaeum guaymaensis]HDO81339.1 cell division protein SepF [Candidatus Bathyarchaeota archaeon]
MGIIELFKRKGRGHGSLQEAGPHGGVCSGIEPETFNLCMPEEVYIKSIPLIMLSDVQRAAGELRAGNIVILHIKPMLQRDRTRNELKRAVDQLRGICRQLDGDIAQLGREYIIVTPGPFIKIYKPEPKPPSEEKEGEEERKADGHHAQAPPHPRPHVQTAMVR